MARLNAIRPAARPKMHGRAMLSGPSGAGKTWTALGMARVLAEGDMSRVLVIDTERESALTYADVFPGFQHLPWRPPFDPSELADTYDQLGDKFAVVITDSFTHFWRGLGGTLDIADGKIGGWKAARPVQEGVIQSVLAVPAHMILCVRSKMEYLISDGGKTVTKLGMAPVQDDTLVYEMNVALDLDSEHRITVTKSRTPAVPVGRMYPAGLEAKCAEDYSEWLAGGVPPAAHEDVARIVARFADVADAEVRKVVKSQFVECFGMPHSLTAAQLAEAEAWLESQLVTDPGTPGGAPQGPGMPTEATPEATEPTPAPADGALFPDPEALYEPPPDATPDGPRTPQGAAEAPGRTDVAPEAQTATQGLGFDPSDLPAERTAKADLRWVAKAPVPLVTECGEAVKAMSTQDVLTALEAEDLPTTGNAATCGQRLAMRRIRIAMEAKVDEYLAEGSDG